MTTAWFQSFRDIRIFHDLGLNEDFTVSKKSNVILYKKCVLHMSLNILHTLAESLFFLLLPGRWAGRVVAFQTSLARS